MEEFAKSGSGLSNIVTSAVYNLTFNVPTSQTDARGNVTTYAINGTTGLLTSTTQPTSQRRSATL